jgi:glutathione S-transferase
MRRELNFCLVYPQVFGHHKFDSAEGQAERLRRGKEQSTRWLRVLDKSILGTNPYLCGQQLTIADFFGGPIVVMAEIFGSDLTKFPNVRGWLARLKQLKSWPPTFATIEGFAASVRNPELVVL